MQASDVQKPEQIEFGLYILIVPALLIVIMFSSFSEIDFSRELAKDKVISLSKESDEHAYMVSRYFECREAKIERGECVSQATYLTESEFGKGIAARVSIDLKTSLSAADNFEENYEVFYSAIQFRAWRHKYLSDE